MNFISFLEMKGNHYIYIQIPVFPLILVLILYDCKISLVWLEFLQSLEQKLHQVERFQQPLWGRSAALATMKSVSVSLSDAWAVCNTSDHQRFSVVCPHQGMPLLQLCAMSARNTKWPGKSDEANREHDLCLPFVHPHRSLSAQF